MIYDSLGAASPTPLNLADPAVLKEVKFLMLMLAPELTKDASWLTSGWSQQASDAYKKIWQTKIASPSGLGKHDHIAHTEGGVAKLGLSATSPFYYPSIYGIAAMGNAIVASGDMTAQQLQDASPALRAHGKMMMGQNPPVGAGVTPPRQDVAGSAKSGGGMWIVGGLLVVGAAVVVLGRKS